GAESGIPPPCGSKVPHCARRSKPARGIGSGWIQSHAGLITVAVARQLNIFHPRTRRAIAEMKHIVAKTIARCGNHSDHTQKAAKKTIVSKPSAMPAR